jgi:3-hydroxyisobutyrate dehydrogenase
MFIVPAYCDECSGRKGDQRGSRKPPRTMATKAALVGAGALGRAILERLVRAGVAMTTYDVSPASLEAAREAGSAIAESPADAARDAEYVHVCVRTDEQLLDGTLGTAGVLAAMRPRTVLILHSTVLPETTRRVGEAAAKRGVGVVDAAVIGIPSKMRAGDASFLVGGPKDVADALGPHLQAIARTVYYFGPLGAGNAAKIAKNLMTAADRVVLVETLELAETAGLDARRFLDMLRVEFHSQSRDWELAFDIENGHAEQRPTTNLFDKDIRHAADFAAQLGLDLPVTRSIAERAAQWVAAWRRNGAAAKGGNVTRS